MTSSEDLDLGEDLGEDLDIYFHLLVVLNKPDALVAGLAVVECYFEVGGVLGVEDAVQYRMDFADKFEAVVHVCNVLGYFHTDMVDGAAVDTDIGGFGKVVVELEVEAAPCAPPRL